MKFTYTTEANREVTFNSESSFEDATEWYGSTPKVDIINYCKHHDADIFEIGGKALASDWHDIAMELWAKNTTSEGTRKDIT